MAAKRRIYLDIETTGLSRRRAELTVIGLAIEEDASLQVYQLVGPQITAERLAQHITPESEVYTYNGSRFDLPFIQRHLDIRIQHLCPHTDLMYACWKHNLKGGLKVVERLLGIPRLLPDVNGYMAVRLWWQYVNDNNTDALNTLLAYNREDVVNLRVLRNILGID